MKTGRDFGKLRIVELCILIGGATVVFSSLIFLYIFLPVCLLLYFLFPQMKVKNGVLIAASVLFYAWGEPVYVLLLIAVSLLNYLFGIILGKCKSDGGRKALLGLCIALDLAALLVFKYAGMLVDTVNVLASLSIPVPNLRMPIGISFFTFQTMSYSIDVYRGNVKTQRSFWRFLLYVSLFPQLIAGPIVRYAEIEPQLEQRTTTAEDAFCGMFRFFLGLGKKVLLANYAAKAVALLLDGNLAGATVAGTWFGMIMFALQIYFDFSGYSDMAIGLGRIFGFRYSENFNLPYISHSITEFWRRWHISLGSFFRDYVYIPMGGNRKHQVLNLFVVWALTGLWHGASWNFLFWGLYFFILLAIEKLCGKVLNWIPKLIRIPFTLFFVVLGWTIFYFTDFARLWQVLGILFGNAVLYKDSVGITMMNHLPLLAVCILGCTPLPRMCGVLFGTLCDREHNPSAPFGKAVQAIVLFVIMLCILFLCTASLTGSSYNPFLYFRF